MHPGVTVPVGYIYFAGGRHRHARGTVERRPAASDRGKTGEQVRLFDVAGVRRLVPDAQRHPQVSLERELADGMVNIVGAVDRPVAGDPDTVRPAEDTLTPRRHEAPWRSKTITGCGLRLNTYTRSERVNCQPPDIGERIARRQLGPTIDQFVGMVTVAKYHLHPPSIFFIGCQ